MSATAQARARRSQLLNQGRVPVDPAIIGLEAIIRDELTTLQARDGRVGDIRGRGAMMAIELTDADAGWMGRLMVAATKVALAAGCADGWRTIINTGRIGRQEVMHLHVHLLGGGNEPLPIMLKR